MFNREKFLKKFCFGKGLWLSVMAVILGLMVLAPMVVTAEKPNVDVFPVDSEPYGITYADWSAYWWQWVLSIPKDSNPLMDKTGEFCGVEQSGDVWFLAGTLGGTAKRKCTIPAGKAILFPIINAECSTIEGNGETEIELRNCANLLINHVVVKQAIVDNVALKDLDDYRVLSPLFTFTLPPDNILGITGGTSIPSNSVSDGFWILLEPLPAGQHDIQIIGVAPFPEFRFTFRTKVTYHLTVE